MIWSPTLIISQGSSALHVRLEKRHSHPVHLLRLILLAVSLGLSLLPAHATAAKKAFSEKSFSRSEVAQVLQSEIVADEVATTNLSPFGETLRATGPVAKSNPFRFSTKFTDQESDLVYYGYRYYSPSLMRWISRDPLGQKAGLNVYAFVLNRPVTLYDKDGRIIPILVAGASGAVLGGFFGAITDTGWYTGAIIGAISGLSGGAFLAMEMPAVAAGMLSGGIGSSLGVVAGGGNPLDGGAGSISVVFGMGLGAAGGFLGTKFAEALDESLALDIALGLASGSSEGAFSAYMGIATGLRGLGGSTVGDHAGQLQSE